MSSFAQKMHWSARKVPTSNGTRLPALSYYLLSSLLLTAKPKKCVLHSVLVLLLHAASALSCVPKIPKIPKTCAYGQSRTHPGSSSDDMPLVNDKVLQASQVAQRRFQELVGRLLMFGKVRHTCPQEH